MSEWQLQTPVAFLIFNRPDTTERVFTEIAKGKPKKLLVVGDGPRPDRPGEAEKCAAAQAIIDRVDWDCEVLRNYSDTNLGCKKRVSSGLDWVFNTVEEAIILEDDCLPHPTFFRFCQELLGCYRDDERIFMISGTNILSISGTNNGLGDNDDCSYFFSKYPHIWGWASWRRAWKYYDVTMKLWPSVRGLRSASNMYGTRKERIFWRNCFDSVYENRLNTWDAQVTFAAFYNNLLTIFPYCNLITNIGFGDDATHTNKAGTLGSIESHSIKFPLKHPDHIVVNDCKDFIRRKLEYSRPNFIMRVLNKIRSRKR